jgi:hypothetical protein
MADIIVKKCIINENLFAFSSYLDVGSDYIYIYCDWRTLLHSILLRMPSYLYMICSCETFGANIAYYIILLIDVVFVV